MWEDRATSDNLSCRVLSWLLASPTFSIAALYCNLTCLQCVVAPSIHAKSQCLLNNLSRAHNTTAVKSAFLHRQKDRAACDDLQCDVAGQLFLEHQAVTRHSLPLAVQLCSIKSMVLSPQLKALCMLGECSFWSCRVDAFAPKLKKAAQDDSMECLFGTVKEVYSSLLESATLSSLHFTRIFSFLPPHTSTSCVLTPFNLHGTNLFPQVEGKVICEAPLSSALWGVSKACCLQ
jgi:hypothetical protein